MPFLQAPVGVDFAYPLHAQKCYITQWPLKERQQSKNHYMTSFRECQNMDFFYQTFSSLLENISQSNNHLILYYVLTP